MMTSKMVVLKTQIDKGVKMVGMVVQEFRQWLFMQPLLP